jgi:signal transduction histidine kinase/ligand-binding sensor domain-containing protein/DNA-binding response OmpR family regulator
MMSNSFQGKMNKMKRLTFLFIGLFFICSFFANGNIIVEHYSTDDGVPHETVHCALKSSDGFLWFGTWYGLCSFDGVKFKTYNSRNKYQATIPLRKIQHIEEDKYGNLWVKTIDHKLYIFDKKKEQFYFLSNELPKEFSVNAQVIKISKTNDDEFLLLTKDKDLLLASPTKDARATVVLLYRSDIETANSKLTHNIFHESEKFINWVGVDFSIISCRKNQTLEKEAAHYITEKLSKISVSPYTSSCFMNDVFWLGDQKGNVFKINLNNGDIELFDQLSGLGEIQNLLVDKSKLYIAVKNNGIYCCDLDSDSTRSVFISTPLTITNLFCDSYGLTWFVTADNKVISYDSKKSRTQVFTFPEGSIINENVGWQDGKELGMFFLTRSGSIVRIDRENMKMEELKKSISSFSQKLSNLLFDENGILWLTSYDDGIYRASFPKQQFHLFNPSDFGHADIKAEDDEGGVKALFQDENGDIWIGTRKSEVFHFGKEGKVKHCFSSKNYNIGNVYHIMQDRQGRLWFSTKGQGLICAVPDKTNPLGFQFKRFIHNPALASSISGNDIYYTYQDSKGRIWVGAFGGGLNLLQEEDERVIFKHKYNSFSKYPEYGRYMEVRNILEDGEGRIWVGTTDGLMSFDGNFNSSDEIGFEIYQNGLNINNNDIYGLYRDKKGQIWVSVFGGGLNKMINYDNAKKLPLFESYNLKSGINSDVILSIVEDNYNNLWLSTEMGISRFNLSTKMFRNFDKYDGFPSIKMEEGSAIRCNDGTIWFGSKEGILQFDPKKITTNTIAYPTYIVDIKVSNKDFDEWNTDSISVKYLDKIMLKHNQAMFTIEFAALNYYNQNHINYQYILEGYEKEWHFNGKNRIASYTNVPPGEYLFKVRTIDETNPALSSERSLHVTILPPWWKSTVAYIIYILLLTIFLYALFRFITLMIKMRNDVYIEQKLSDLKIKFFTNVSHELRTPLTLIKAPIQELKENENLSDKGKQYVSLMENSTNQMLNLVNQILDFRKIENKKMRLHVSPVNLNMIIKSFYDEFLVLAEENDINYNYHLLQENIVLWADKEKLETVMRNILSNAFKFTPSGGSVLITAGVEEEKQQCFIRIEDTGIGIPQNKLDEIFERFSQGGNIQNVVYQGTGIGLALSRELVLLHHGEIKVESVQNKGSAFTIELPLGKKHFKDSEVDFYISDIVKDFPGLEGVENDEAGIEETAEAQSDLPTLLLVEDNKALCNLIKLQLEDKFNVYIAHDGQEGLKKVHLYYPDVIITDQVMPTMDGLELLKQIRDDFRISHIPVILLTAKNDDEIKIQSLHLGANAYITKPFSKKHLIARIEQLLNERKLFRERFWNKNDNSDQHPDDYGRYFVEKDVDFLNKIRQIIEENLDNSDFNIDAIASSLNLSRSAFFKKLKSITGLAPVDLVKDIRLNKAVELMRKTDMSISEIAFAVGFKDAGYFGKCFKKKYQLSPRDYLNAYKK